VRTNGMGRTVRTAHPTQIIVFQKQTSQSQQVNTLLALSLFQMVQP
jgi:hypothetical protein